MSKEERDIEKREHVLDEIIYTERNYVNKLSIVIEIYIKPLRDSEIISRDDLVVQVSCQSYENHVADYYSSLEAGTVSIIYILHY